MGIDHPEIAPTIAFLKTSASASFLKEFFEVSVVMKNMADPQFVLVDSVATLNLPRGLALAPMYEQQSLTAQIGTIVGGQEVSHSWIVRGDEPGDYVLSVDYTGRLMPFKEPVSATFKTETPLTVNGARGLEITLYPNEYVCSGMNYLIPFAIENKSEDITFNMVTMHFNGSTVTRDPNESPPISSENGTNYVIDTVAGMDTLPLLYDGDSVTIRELVSGDVLYGSYITEFDIEDTWDYSIYRLRDSFVETLDGSTVSIPVNIEMVEGLPPEVIAHIIASLSKHMAVEYGSIFIDALLFALMGVGMPASAPLAYSNWEYNREIMQNNPISGFIYGQANDPVAGLKMGAFGNVSDNGCGAVATYNVLQMLGDAMNIEDIILCYDGGGSPLVGGVAGHNPLSIRILLSALGYEVKSTYLPEHMNSTIKDADAAIYIYAYSVGGMHYVAVNWDDSIGKYVVYNAYSNDGEGREYESFDVKYARGSTPIEIITINRR